MQPRGTGTRGRCVVKRAARQINRTPADCCTLATHTPRGRGTRNSQHACVTTASTLAARTLSASVYTSSAASTWPSLYSAFPSFFSSSPSTSAWCALSSVSPAPRPRRPKVEAVNELRVGAAPLFPGAPTTLAVCTLYAERETPRGSSTWPPGDMAASSISSRARARPGRYDESAYPSPAGAAASPSPAPTGASSSSAGPPAHRENMASASVFARHSMRWPPRLRPPNPAPSGRCRRRRRAAAWRESAHAAWHEGGASVPP